MIAVAQSHLMFNMVCFGIIGMYNPPLTNLYGQFSKCSLIVNDDTSIVLGKFSNPNDARIIIYDH